MTNYVVGLLFDYGGGNLLMVEKDRPEWQAGKFNGIGGKVEEGETFYHAMARETREETGLHIDDWQAFAEVHSGNDRIVFFRSFSGGDFRGLNPQPGETESLHVVQTQRLITRPIIPNLRFLIPLAMHTTDLYEPVIFKEI